MQSIAKSLLITIIVSISILLFTNLINFFPWYMTLIVETFNVSQTASERNYLLESEYNDALDRIGSRPIFRENDTDVNIIVLNADQYPALGRYEADYYAEMNEVYKPYRQRGDEIVVTVSAKYPFQVTLWGNTIRRDLDVSFTLKTVGLKHYKDLEYYN